MTRFQSAQAAKVVGKKGFSLITAETFRELYTGLLLCRMLDERLGARTGCGQWRGREAGSAGVAACLRRGDTVTATARGVLAGYLQNRFIDLDHNATDPGAELAAAVEAARRHKLARLDRIAVVYGGCTEPERMRQIFAAASGQSLPVVFIFDGCTNLNEVHGSIPVIRVDGSDTVAVYRVASESINRAREGGGPTILECAAWPFEAEASDPLFRLEQYLAVKKHFHRAWKRRLEKEYAEEVDLAVKAAENASLISKPANAERQNAMYTRRRNAVA